MMKDNLYDTCFYGLQDPKIWGYSTKRIRVTIPGTITDYIVCSGYGYKDKKTRGIARHERLHFYQPSKTQPPISVMIAA